MARLDDTITSVGEQERAGPERDLRVAPVEARLSEHSRLLVTGRSGDRERPPEPPRVGLAVDLRAAADLGQHRRRNLHEPNELVVPDTAMNVEEERPRRIGDVRDVDATAGEAGDQERLDGPGGQLAAFRAASQ